MGATWTVTKHLHEHSSNCKPEEHQFRQHEISNYMLSKAVLSRSKNAHLDLNLVNNVVNGAHSFRTIENEGFLYFLQTFVGYATIHGKFDIAEELPSRNTVICRLQDETESLRVQINNALLRPQDAFQLATKADMYTGDLIKRSYFNVHAL